MSLWIFIAAQERMGLGLLSKEETSDLQGEQQLPARATAITSAAHYRALTNRSEELQNMEVKAGAKPNRKVLLRLLKLAFF